MQKLLLFLGLCASVIYAADSVPTPPAASAPEVVPSAFLAPAAVARTAVPATGKNLWRASLAALAVANALDVQSSWGKHELNATLASPSGNFGAQGALLKLGFQGGLAGVEFLLTRHHPSARLYRALSIINFAAAAGITGVAAHNYTVAPPGR
ncbi:MAG TPA: hypothetical protein VME43_21100 [Bryobacteraceae bacterium]|nr:hypothetical protein [Bryobacteraceae bacterium]